MTSTEPRHCDALTESRGTVPVPALLLENSAFYNPSQRSRGRDGPATSKLELNKNRKAGIGTPTVPRLDARFKLNSRGKYSATAGTGVMRYKFAIS